MSASKKEMANKINLILAAIDPSLYSVEKEQMKDLVNHYERVFGSKDGKLARTDIVNHMIDSGAANPIRQAPRRLPQVKKEETEGVFQEMVEPSMSPGASPVVLVRKKDGLTRFYVDYRKFNDNTKKDSYPLLGIDDALGGFQVAFYARFEEQIRIRSIKKRRRSLADQVCGSSRFFHLAFVTPATFEWLMENILRTYVVYLYNVIIMSKTFKEYLVNLRGLK